MDVDKLWAFFPPCLTVTAEAKAGEPFHLPSYTTFVVGSLFGWYRTDSNRLRLRTAWVEAGKCQIKSPVAAALGLYTMGFRGIPRAECYAIARDRNQARCTWGGTGDFNCPRSAPTLKIIIQISLKRTMLGYQVDFVAKNGTP